MSTTFDDVTHTYRIDGRIVPSVTTVIASAQLSNFNGTRGLDWYLDRGRAFHLAAQLWDEGDLDDDSVDPEIRGQLDAYIACRELVGDAWDTLDIEVPRFHRLYGFAGTPDRHILWHGQPAIVDLKTGSPAKWHAIQTAAYAELIRTSTPTAGPLTDVARFSLYCATDGTWKMQAHEATDDWGVFASALAVYNWRDRHGLIPTTKGVTP